MQKSGLCAWTKMILPFFFSFLIRIADCCKGRVRSLVKRRAEGAVWWEPAADGVSATLPSSEALKYLLQQPSKAACSWGRGDRTSSSPFSPTPSVSHRAEPHEGCQGQEGSPSFIQGPRARLSKQPRQGSASHQHLCIYCGLLDHEKFPLSEKNKYRLGGRWEREWEAAALRTCSISSLRSYWAFCSEGHQKSVRGQNAGDPRPGASGKCLSQSSELLRSIRAGRHKGGRTITKGRLFSPWKTKICFKDTLQAENLKCKSAQPKSV